MERVTRHAIVTSLAWVARAGRGLRPGVRDRDARVRAAARTRRVALGRRGFCMTRPGPRGGSDAPRRSMPRAPCRGRRRDRLPYDHAAAAPPTQESTLSTATFPFRPRAMAVALAVSSGLAGCLSPGVEPLADRGVDGLPDDDRLWVETPERTVADAAGPADAGPAADAAYTVRGRRQPRRHRPALHRRRRPLARDRARQRHRRPGRHPSAPS